MNNKKHLHHITDPQKIKGFSLIEFLVASALSMIVLVAVSKGYFTARQLNESAGERINTQQDIRNAANMVVRDARMAGSFGCFSMAAETEKYNETVGSATVKADRAVKGSRTIKDGNTGTNGHEAFKLENNADNLMPIRQIARNNFNPNGFAPASDALVFMYGAENPASGDPLVFSSCTRLIRPANDNMPANTAEVRKVLGLGADTSEAAVMRYAVYAYAAGSIGGQRGLFRFQLTGNSWGSPQLLVSNIQTATFKYMYVNNCPDGAGHTETFEYSDKLSRIPALVRIRLIPVSGGVADSNQIYDIDAAVRGGNLCANRKLS